MASFWAGLRPIGSFLSSDTTLVTIGIVLAIAAIVAWKMSNRAEATPKAGDDSLCGKSSGKDS